MANITVDGSKNVNFNKQIKVDGGPAVTFTADINTANPDQVNGMTPYINDQVLYKENRTAIKAEITKCEDEVYAEQEKMLAEIAGGK